jgi:hypothetical protein
MANSRPDLAMGRCRQWPDADRAHEAERCRKEITAIEAQIRAGNPDVEGLCGALSDWAAELALILAEEEGKPPRVVPAARR